MLFLVSQCEQWNPVDSPGTLTLYGEYTNVDNLFPKIAALKQQKSVFYLFGISMAILEALICHTKVRHFANIVVIEENVSSRQVTMNNLPEDKKPEYKSWKTIGFYSTAAKQTSEYVWTKKKAQTKVALYNVVMLTKPRFLLSLSKNWIFLQLRK